MLPDFPAFLKCAYRATILAALLSAAAFGAAQRFERIAMGEWSVEEKRILQKDTQGTTFLLAGEQSLSRYSVSTRVRFASGGAKGEAGLAIHFTDPDNYIAFTVANRRAGRYAVLRIARKKPQVTFVADQAPVPQNDGYELRADVDGRNVSCYVDGKPLLAYSFEGTPPPYNSHGKTWDPDPEKGWTGLTAVDTPAEFAGFHTKPLAGNTKTVTPQTGRWDERGRLLPRQSYAETMRRFTDWFANSEQIVDPGKAPESLQKLPPYLVTNFVATDDTLWNVGGEFAFNHALVMTGAVQYYTFTGDRRYLNIAIRTADWQIEHATPADWAMPYLAPSFVAYEKDGSWKGMDWGYEPEKTAYVGLALLKLYGATSETKYLEAAQRIAATLRKYQGPEGNWPFRVNARTGETKHGYGCSQLWYVWFFEHLAQVTGDKSYLKHRDLAFDWLMKNPMATNEWIGLYGDIASGARSFDQWVALEMAMYLIDRREQNPEYLNKAKGILDWINRTLVVDYGFFPSVPGLVEQSQYRIVLTHHELRLAELYAKLWEATRDTAYKELAIQIANSVTWVVMSDGKLRQGFWDHAKATPLILSFNEQFARIMAAIPETAPRGENHLQQSSGIVKQITYEPKAIRYSTFGESNDLLTVAATPKTIRSGTTALARQADARLKPDSWSFDEQTGLLRVNHKLSEVHIELQ